MIGYRSELECKGVSKVDSTSAHRIGSHDSCFCCSKQALHAFHQVSTAIVHCQMLVFRETQFSTLHIIRCWSCIVVNILHRITQLRPPSVSEIDLPEYRFHNCYTCNGYYVLYIPYSASPERHTEMSQCLSTFQGPGQRSSELVTSSNS